MSDVSPLSLRAAHAPASAVRALLELTARPDVLSLAPGLPDAAALPAASIAALLPDLLGRRGPYGPTALQYGPTEGDPDLRALLAARHGVTPDRVLVTAGSQQALDLLAHTLADPGDTVVVEAPTYVGALQAFRSAGLRIVAMPGDAEGMGADGITDLLAGGRRPRAVYVVSRFANPSGACLTPERAAHLAEVCARQGVPIIDDEAYADLGFTGAAGRSPWPDAAPRIVVGTASKTVAPGLRVGWIIAPAHIVGAAARIKQSRDLHSSGLGQAVVAAMLADPDRFAAHVADVVATLAARADVLHDALRRHAGGLLTATPARGGMFLWARIADGAPDADVLLGAAAAAGVAFVPGSAFQADGGGDRHMRLAFSALPADRLQEAARRLGAVLRAARAGI